MRTYFELADAEAYEAAKELLIRRCRAWAQDQDTPVDPVALSAALDFRHHGIDGRLGYWTGDLIDEFLLVTAPANLVLSARDAAELPATLRVLLHYLHATGLADPTGDPLAVLDRALSNSGQVFPAAMADARNFGVAKFWLMTAAGQGVDLTDGAAVQRFLTDARAGQVDYDEDVLAEILQRAAREGDDWPERAVAQLPVSLPPEAELASVAEHTTIVAQLRALVDWVGDGRALTTTGNLKLSDARELVPLLGTGDPVGLGPDEPGVRIRSSTELSGLVRLVELAKQARVVRVVKNRLVRVAKAAPLLRDGLALWTAAFDGLPIVPLLPRRGWAPQHAMLFESLLDQVLPDVLNTVYGLPEPMPVVRLVEGVWSACAEAFDLDDLDADVTAVWRRGVGVELRQVLGLLAEFGAVELTVASADPMYRADLAVDWESETDDIEEPPFPPEVRDRLLAALDPDGGPVELVALTPLATRAVHGQLVRAGRYAPLVGELSDAEPAQLLGMIAEHYDKPAGAAEIAGWLAAHGGQEHGMALLLEGIRGCPFRSRAAMMLDLLAELAPDRSAFLRALRPDPQLGPIVTQLLVDDGELVMDELDAAEGLRGMTEHLIHMLELGGLDAVGEALAEIPTREARELLPAMLAAGHPDQTGLAELDALVRTRLNTSRPGHATVHPLGSARRANRPGGRGKRRR